MPLLIVAFMIVIPMFVRELRPITPLIFAVILIRNGDLTALVRGSSLFRLLLLIMGIMPAFALVQWLGDEDVELALLLRQLSYYFLFPVIVAAYYVSFERYGDAVLHHKVMLYTTPVFITLCVLYDFQFEDGLEIRPNFETTSVYLFLVLTHAPKE